MSNDVQEKYICASCIQDDDFIKQFVHSFRNRRKCSYCNHIKSVVPFNEAKELIDAVIQRYYMTVEEEMPREDGEWVFLDTPYDGNGIIQQFLDDGNFEFVKDMVGFYFDNTWIRRDWRGDSISEILLNAWNKFCHEVKHNQRYFFTFDTQLGDEAFGIPVGKMLSKLLEVVYACGMFTTINEGFTLYRARPCDCQKPYTLQDELGSPPKECAKSLRLNPAGIPHFYGAFEEITAIKEVSSDDGSSPFGISLGYWQVTRSLEFLDFTKLPNRPSIFDLDKFELFHQHIFLTSFLEDIGRPVELDGREHIDYVPTQIISEFVRKNIKSVDGVIYNSVKNIPGKCFTLFPQSDDYQSPEENRIELFKSKHIM